MQEPGPFEPPKEYTFEPELKGDPVRPIPPELRQGRYGLQRHGAIRLLAISGFACLASAELPLMDTLSYYLLPLAYLNWIGIALLVWAAGSFLYDQLERGPYLWVKNASPFIARVLKIVVQPSLYVNGQPTNWRFNAEIEWRGPDGNMLSAWTQSADLNDPGRHTTSFRVGDYVTALRMPPKDEVQVYGFLGLKPGLGVVDRDARDVLTTRQLVLRFAAGIGFFVALFYGIKYMPVELPGDAFLKVIGALFLLAAWPGHGLARRWHESRLAALAERNQAAIARGEALLYDSNVYEKSNIRLYFDALLVGFGVLLVGAFVLFTANAALDFRPREKRFVHIDEMIQTTWNGVFREYKIEFHFLDKNFKQTGSKESLMSTPSHMALFKTRGGIASIGNGLFGMKWVEGIEPFNPPSPEEGAAGASR